MQVATDPAGGPPRGLEESLREEGLALEPLHPGTEGTPLGTWFSIEVEPPMDAERLAVRVGRWPGVEAAYVEPPEGPPR